MSNRPLAYVMGDMDLVAPLGRVGIPCVSIIEPGEPPRWSRYVRRTIDDLGTWHAPEVMANQLVAAARSESEPPVLFYQSDPQQLMVSRLRDRLAPALRFVTAEPTLVEDLIDKARFADLAARMGLDVPVTLVLQPGTPLPPPSALQMPLIVKPALRRTDDWAPTAGSAKAMQVSSYETLEALWAKFEPAGTGIVVQELVEGPESAIESYHLYADAQGEIVGEFTGRKIRTWPAAFGLSCAVEVLDIPEVRRIGRDIVERIGLTGVAKLDFKRDARNRLRLLEINARFNLWHFPGALAGVNLPALVYADLVGEPRPAVRRVTAPVRWVKPWHDIRAARAAGVPLHRWARFAARCPAKSSLYWRDPGAALAAVVYGFRRSSSAGPDVPSAAEAPPAG